MSRIIDLPSRNRTPVRHSAPWPLLIGTGVFLFVAGLGSGALLTYLLMPVREKVITQEVRSTDGPKKDDTSKGVPAKKTPLTPIPGEELKALLKGKTQEEIKALLGTPESSRDEDKGYKSWTYRDVILDPDTGKKKPAHVGLHFEDGKWVCYSVTWF